MTPNRLVLGVAEYGAAQTDAGLAALEEAARRDGLSVAWLDVAIARAARSDLVGAGDALDEALRVGDQDAGVALPAGILALQLGDTDTAVAAFAGAFAAAPDIVGDAFWMEDPVLASPRTMAIGVAVESLLAKDRPADAHIVAVIAGREADASAIAGTLSGYQREAAEAAQLAWNGDAGAAGRLAELALEHPLDTYVLDWAARVSQRLGAPDEADRYRTLAVYAEGYGYAGALRILEGSAIDTSPVGEWRFHGHYAYRRPTPWNLLVPGVPRVVVAD
jgi:hypothetical protein